MWSTQSPQIIGAQAVLNVLFGRYVRVSNQLKDLVLGFYGKTPLPIDPELSKKILKNYKRGQVPVTGRPADYLEPEIEAAKKLIGNFARNDEDVLAYILYPATMGKFLRTKYGIDSPTNAGTENIPHKEVTA